MPQLNNDLDELIDLSWIMIGNLYKKADTTASLELISYNRFSSDVELK